MRFSMIRRFILLSTIKVYRFVVWIIVKWIRHYVFRGNLEYQDRRMTRRWLSTLWIANVIASLQEICGCTMFTNWGHLITLKEFYFLNSTLFIEKQSYTAYFLKVSWSLLTYSILKSYKKCRYDITTNWQLYLFLFFSSNFLFVNFHA